MGELCVMCRLVPRNAPSAMCRGCSEHHYAQTARRGIRPVLASDLERPGKHPEPADEEHDQVLFERAHGPEVAS